jgi:DNA (cytosine-5)-methyltransferase 1
VNYLSVCSGIESATVAWHSLGWTPVAFAEIDPFCNALLKFHYPRTSNLGDFTRIQSNDIGTIDLLVGGTPCQSFSVAGARAGLDDPRGNLALEFVRLARRTRPRWVVWENVPGVMSSDGGRDFGTILYALGECGYGFAYRVLNAQYFGVPQRRRRVFVVGYFGDWRPAAAVLFERESMCGYPAPRREQGQGFTKGFEIGPSGNRESDTAPTLDARAKDGPIRNQVRLAVYSASGYSKYAECDTATSMRAVQHKQSDVDLIVPALVSNGDAHSGYRDEHGLVSVIHENKSASLSENDTARALRSGASHSYQFCFQQNTRDEVRLCGGDGQTAGALASEAGMKQQNYIAFQERRRRSGMSVRRLTPREAERLQGFPDDYTLVPYRSKPAADGNRYKALGNSKAVPVVRWIGERIKAVNALLKKEHR